MIPAVPCCLNRLSASLLTSAAENPYPEEVVATNGMFYVFRILEKRPPSPELFSEKESEFRTALLERKKSTILASWLANVRDKAEIEINEQFL